MNEIAQELNRDILQGNPYVYELLSELGKNLYYPKGILTQSAEAKQKAHRFNATIGIATEKDHPMFLPLIQKTLADYNPKDLYPYAPPAGKPELRELWRKKILIDNPSLQDKSFSNPIVTNALTHGLSIVADLFINADDPLVLPDKLWGNYNFIFGVRRGAKTVQFPFYTKEGTFNTIGMKEAILSKKDHGKAVLVLNFPNNPTGYTPTEQDATEIIKALREVAEEGMNLVVVTDDAYFGLFYENSIKESLFARIANIHPRVLAIKVDGATKEDYVWGFRVGFITYASEHPAVLNALEKKTIGIIRGTISSASHPSQTFLIKALQSPDFQIQKQEKFKVLSQRASKVKQILEQEKYHDAWDYYPFNSGYFMCLKLKGVKAEVLRNHLLDQYGVGVISLGENDVRIAFSCVEEQELEHLFDLIYQGYKDLSVKLK
ncbi:aminotransferase class I/II-fold pyridoxal phosphate-dependent enzyme [Desulfosporosinus fructosivorans]|uniref:Aminotransferase class I/II-fold pyridoxal phosphate-dependent enzyme n=1 Tax=Desulfosporosinus fructosivorans TaxID=2018669 RepID=A0A4Z0R9Y7_9FIRM|nr:aminotransferase class I/II-fold pyridoxal phosphate-dependent enzyme [Desulfosporosinus fructosivorans]TGE38426.1 aminotransferase class I/II-fold pyridoxal phosphate-dependent enzyme [Desulfosporosinus fructosivorans]